MNDNLKYWLAINKIPEVGPVTIKKLWDHFGNIRSVWEASPGVIQSIEGLNKSTVKAFLEYRNRIDLKAEVEIVQKNGVNTLTLGDDDYPASLKNIYDPPPVLYFKGNLLKSDERALAIVGTRRASRYGLEFAKQLASQLASLGITIVSGLASGIDTAAHSGAVEAQGRTIAVFGCGVDTIFPAENRDLAKRIESFGACVSEFPIGTPTGKSNFPRRNRIISGLSLGVIVVEGHYDSGAMITAKEALEQGREVFAVPGNVGLEQSKGPHWLIKQGAKLVESVEDVLDELKFQIPNDKSQINAKAQIPKPKLDLSKYSADEQKILSILNSEPKHIDNISAESGLLSSQAASLLMILEIKKAIRQLPGKLFVWN